MKRLVLVLVFFSLFGALQAQDMLSGRVYEDKSTNSVPGITIRNLKNKQVTISDRTGGFMIQAQIGDLVVFTGMSYASDTLYVKDLKYIEVKLVPKSRMLNEVKVTGSEIRMGSMKDTRPLGPLGGQTVVYQTDASGNYKGGMGLNIFDSHSSENKRKLNAKLAEDENTTKQVDLVFSPDNLQKYIPLKGQELKNFIVLYRPDIETFKSPEFNLPLYLSISYKKFMEIPAAERGSKGLTDILGQDLPPPPTPVKQ